MCQIFNAFSASFTPQKYTGALEAQCERLRSDNKKQSDLIEVNKDEDWFKPHLPDFNKKIELRNVEIE